MSKKVSNWVIFIRSILKKKFNLYLNEDADFEECVDEVDDEEDERDLDALNVLFSFSVWSSPSSGGVDGCLIFTLLLLALQRGGGVVTWENFWDCSLDVVVLNTKTKH